MTFINPEESWNPIWQMVAPTQDTVCSNLFFACVSQIIAATASASSPVKFTIYTDSSPQIRISVSSKPPT